MTIVLIINKINNYLLSREKNVKEFIIILYGVGIFGTAIPYTRDIFIILTPFVLLISLFILINYHSSAAGTKIWLTFGTIFIASYLIEVAGVNTGIVFGSYSYGKGLGFKVLNTPILIGLNWVLLVYCTASVFESFRVNNILKISGASMLMVIYDIIMEQVAPHMDMWSFEDGIVPLRNYISWFALAIIFHSVARLAGIRITNKFAPLVFYCQTGFFLVLLVFFKLTE